MFADAHESFYPKTEKRFNSEKIIVGYFCKSMAAPKIEFHPSELASAVSEFEKFVRIVQFPAPFPRFQLGLNNFLPYGRFWRIRQAYDVAYVKFFTSPHY